MIRRALPGLVFVFACALLSFVSVRARAAGVELPTAGQGTDWTLLAIAAGFGGILVGLIAFFRHNPGKVSEAKEAASAATARAEALERGLSSAMSGAITLARQLGDAASSLGDHVKTLSAPAPAPQAQGAAEESIPEAPAPKPGGRGRAGPVTIAATGDPAVDYPAFATEYEKPAPAA